MSYAIIRNANYKKDNLAGLYKHNERKNTNYSNKDICHDNSIFNYSLKECKTTYTNAIKQLQKENNLQGRIIKTTNVACEFVITSDREFFERIGELGTMKYFQTAYNFVAQYKGLGEKYILSAKVHMDESTPHMHIVFVPVVKSKNKQGEEVEKIACSEYWKGKDSYRQLQDNFYSYIKERGFDLERGKAREIEHLSTEKLKQVTNYDNIKYELKKQEIKPIETNDKALIISQNKELVKYVNKLKFELSKSNTTVAEIERLRQENIELREENQTLERENNKLKDYIENVFEVIENLFNFPIERFKRIVNNFMKNFER